MNEPWGLSGPQFLALYAVAYLVSVIAVLALLALIRRGPDADAGPVDVYTMAVLGDGRARVVDTAVFAMIEDGHLRPARSRQLTVCVGANPEEPVQRAVLDAVPARGGFPLSEARRAGGETGPVRRIEALAVDQGLLMDQGRLRAARATLLLPLGVIVMGVARLVNGIRLDRPVGLLAGELIVSVIVLLMVAAGLSRRTRAGERLFTRVRGEHDRNPGVHLLDSYGSTGQSVPAAAIGVALLGAGGIADVTLRTAVFGNAGSAGSSGGSGGGSGCGGGGCGGGGCGGCGG